MFSNLNKDYIRSHYKGDTIGAIRYVRSETGADVKTAKAFVDEVFKEENERGELKGNDGVFAKEIEPKQPYTENNSLNSDLCERSEKNASDINESSNCNNSETNGIIPMIVKFFAVVAVLCVIWFVYYTLSENCIISPHEWTEATCTEPKTCEKCGETEGQALGHDWAEATCTAPKTCKRCGKTEGAALGHSYSEFTVVKNPTCTEKGSKETVCSVCGDKKTEDIPETGHNFTDGEIVTYASLYAQGEKAQKCTKCGATVNVAYDLSDAEKANINLVMNGYLNDFLDYPDYYADYYPLKTIGDTFNGFFSHPLWYADSNVVVFSGICTWAGEPATCGIRFKVNGNSFTIEAFDIDGTTINDSIAIDAFLSKIYEW